MFGPISILGLPPLGVREVRDCHFDRHNGFYVSLRV
jgi:hypothetical protein